MRTSLSWKILSSPATGGTLDSGSVVDICRSLLNNSGQNFWKGCLSKNYRRVCINQSIQYWRIQNNQPFFILFCSSLTYTLFKPILCPLFIIVDFTILWNITFICWFFTTAPIIFLYNLYMEIPNMTNCSLFNSTAFSDCS